MSNSIEVATTSMSSTKCERRFSKVSVISGTVSVPKRSDSGQRSRINFTSFQYFNNSLTTSVHKHINVINVQSYVIFSYTTNILFERICIYKRNI